jgi:alkylhydroperoxidase family enzyme
MTRLHQVHRDKVRSIRVPGTYSRCVGDRDPVTEPGPPSGAPGNWWTVFAPDPQFSELVLDRIQWQTSSQRRFDSLLHGLCITRAGWACGSKFVFSQHGKRLRIAGASEEQVSAISDWVSATCYWESERAVRGYVDDLLLAAERRVDSSFHRLRECFPTTQYWN